MKGKILKKVLAAALVLTLVTGGMPIAPGSDMFGNTVITANAADTATSTITVDNTDYTLFTGFTATDGSTGVGSLTYDKAVDGDMSSSWHDQSSGVYVEFNTDDPIVPKGYIFNTYMEGYFYPQAWVLKAKANATDDWTTLSSYSGQTLSSGQEFRYACSNDGNTAYKYFRFEASNTNNNIWLTEIRLYGNEYIYYTHLTVTPATCTEVGIKKECYKRSDGKYFTDETGATELTEADVIDPMIPHTGVHHAADANHIEYWQCSMCNKYFSDAGCTTEITQTQGVTYLDESGTEQTCLTYTTMTDGSTSLTAGWYVVNDDVTIADRISVSGTVNLILGNNSTLTASKGITVGSDATLNIYAQTNDEATMGALVASGANGDVQYNAGIGGVDNTAAGTITINGGKINATGMMGAGIGSGGEAGATVGTITINGGIVTAQDGSGYGAGIGGGGWGGKAGTINLNGGVIHAAGIGSGYSGGDCSITVNISDGVKKIVATPVQGGACIGSGKLASGSVTVNFKSGGNVVTGNDKDAVFYDTGEGVQRQVRARALNHAVTMSNDLKANITATPEYALTGETVTLTLGTAVDASTLKVNDGTSDLTLTDAGNRQYTFTMPDGNVTVTATAAQSYAVTLPANMEVVSATNAADANGKYITGTTVTFKASFPYAASDVSDGTNTLTATDGIYSVTIGTADVTVTATVERSATIDLSGATDDFTVINNDVLTGTTSHTVTIASGASITLSDATITGGIVCNGTATITLVGTNIVNVNNAALAYSKAGIQIGGNGTTLTIRGNGSLTATGGSAAAGIGLGRTWDASVTAGAIVIEGGTVNASGDIGIGIGTVGNSQTATIDGISIKGGTVSASLGKGYIYNGSTATIGYIKIYDTIDMVDASKITETVTYMHVDGETATDVTANKTDFFTIGEDGDRRIIVQKVTPTIADVPDQTYTGSAITPEPTVIAGSLSLTKGTDYVYSYTNNTNVGTAKVRATFQGIYSSLGYVEEEFTILPSTVVVNVTGNGTVTYNDKVATNGEVIGVVADKGTDVTLTLAPESGYAVSIEYGYTNNSGTTASGFKLPINGTTATLTVPDNLKDGTYVNLTVTFVSALVGGADEASAVALTDNTVTNLAGGWYKVDSNITFGHTLNLLGDTHLIIADGKTMTVNTATDRGIDSDYTLTVSGAGVLNVTTTGDYGVAVRVGNYVQSGATVTASGYIGIRCKDNFEEFNVTNDFTFSGGQLTVTGTSDGIWADNTITISCTNASDFIQASSYSSAYGAVKIAEGNALTDGTEASNGMNGYSGTLTNEQITAIGGKTLVRAYTVTLPESITGGTITADRDYVAANADDKTVTLTVTPNEHYQVKSVTVNGTAATKVDDTHYSFTMPAGDVTVSAEFELQKHTVSISSENCQIIVRKITDNDSYGVVVHNGDKIEYGTKLIYDVAADYGYYLGNENGTIYTTKTYETTVNGDTAITAVGYAKNYRLSLYTYGGGGSPVIIGEHDYAPYNSYLTIRAGTPNEGYEFVGWYQTNGKFLSSDEEYNVKMTSGMSIRAQYRRTSGVVIFMANDQIQNEFTDAGYADYYSSFVPSAKYGYVFTGWDKTLEEINTALTSGNVIVTANFAPKKETFTVTINNGEVNADETVSCEESTLITRTAKAVEGKTFAYWMKDDALFTYNPKISFTANAECVITAVYTSNTVTEKTTAEINKVSYVDGNLIIKAGMSVPDGMTIVSVGIRTSSNSDMSDAAVTTATTSNNPAEFAVTKSGVAVNAKVYAQAYVTYRDTNNVETTINGSIMTITAGQDYDAAEKGTATIRSAIYNADTKKATFNAYLTVPENAVIVKAGLVAAPSTSFNPESAVLTADYAAENSGFVKSLSTAEGKCVPVNYTWYKSNVNTGDTWYARAYLVYTLNGEQHTVYGSLVELKA